MNDELDSEYSTTEIPDPDHNPSRTNECVRRILNIFEGAAEIQAQIIVKGLLVR